MSLVARELESQGIATVVIGSAIDIVEHCGVPRYLFVDFPLGNPCGPPYDRPSQAAIASQAFDLLETATAPRTTVRSRIDWPGPDGWRQNYNHVGPDNVEELKARGEERRKVFAATKKTAAAEQ